MTSSRRWLIRICLTLLLPVTGAVAADATAPVSVDSVGATLKVRVASPTPLRAVLETLCERTQASCKLPKGMPDLVVTPRTIAGPWGDVVAELLQGSELSFGTTPPAPGRVPHLVVEPPAAVRAGATLEAAKGAAAPPSPGNPSEGPSAGPVPAIVEEEPQEEQPTAIEASAAPVDPSQASLVTAATAAATPDVAFAMTPFADANGNPLMSRVSAPPAGMAVLPYSDEAGNPLVTPITNEPLSLTPFSGPDGEAWPAPVLQPGQPPLQYPMPPNVPASNPSPDKS